MKRVIAAVGFLACVPLANWTVQHVGTTCIPEGPCLVPVWPGLMAPSGVLWVGFALVLRDGVQEALGTRWAAGLVLAGAGLSWFVAPPALAVASALAFGVAEGLDMLVFSRMRGRSLAAAVLVSGIVGLLVDSALFLALAFGSLEHLAGQVVGKAYGLVVGLAWVAYRAPRRRHTSALHK